MTETRNITESDVLAWTSEIVAAYVANNTVAQEDLAGLIQDVHATLLGIDSTSENHVLPEPAVPIKKSVTPDYIVCLEDGKKLKMLKRHLNTAYGMSPEDYRKRWGLAPDYPMVAPNYAKHRSSLAKKIGLGTNAEAKRGKARK
jgi:predicted transcriptional regulator